MKECRKEVINMNDLPAKLSILTTMNKAIELYPMTVTSWKDPYPENFLKRFRIDFHQPNYGMAVIYSDQYAPDKVWFSLFEEAEKRVVDDDYNFFGVMYETSVKAAKKRIQVLIEKIRKVSVEKMSEYRKRMHTRTTEEIQQIEKVLDLLGVDDEIHLEFLFKEWPSSEEMKATDYVKEFQDKIMVYKGKSLISLKDNDIPF